MLLLQKVFLFSLLALFFQQATTDPKQALNDQLFEAVRKGDVAAVTAALDKGADVNAKFRYGATALFKAAERGHTEIAKVLLDRGADVKVKDTFYGATAMTWAVDNKHVGVIRLLLEKSADDIEDVLLTGTREGNEELVKVALDRGSAKPETLTVALAMSSADEESKHHRDVEEGGSAAAASGRCGDTAIVRGQVQRRHWSGSHVHGEGRQAVCWRIHARATATY